MIVNHRLRRRFLVWVAEHAALLTLAILFLTPVAFVIFTSCMSPRQTLTSAIWPNPWDLANYIRAFTEAPIGAWFGNSALYAFLGTACMLISSVPAAYVLAKVPIRCANVIFGFFIAAMLLPPQVTIVPLYIMWAKVDFTGTLWPLIIPLLFGDAFSIFLMRQFFLTIPSDYLDAAKMDGNGDFGTFLRVAVPMAKPGIAAATIFMFFQCWNDYFGPLVYTSENTASWPVAYGLATFHGSHGTDWGTTMAVTVLVTIPEIVVFFFAQRAFVEGIALTGVKA